jgi:hypothetical protein
VYFGVAWFFEDHKIGHVLPAFKDMLSGDGMVDKGDLGVEHFLLVAFQAFKSFHGVIRLTSVLWYINFTDQAFVVSKV